MDHANTIANAMIGFAQHQTWSGERDALLGDFAGNVIAAGAPYPRSVYWHNMPGEVHEMGTAVLSSDTNVLYQENSLYVNNPPAITIGYPPRSRILTVKGGASTAAALAIQGNTSQIEQYINRIGNPHIYNIFDLRIRPTDTTSTSIYIEAGFYERLSSPGIKRRFSGTSLDLSSRISALASGQHQLGIVYLDRETEVLGVILTAASSAVGSLPSRNELADLTSIRLLSRQKELGTIYLYYGQASSTITQSDILSTLDPRFSRSEQPGLTSAIFRNGLPMSRLSKAVYI